MSKVHFQANKLIRDKTAERLAAKNIIVQTRALQDEEFILQLKTKLAAEVEGVKNSSSPQELFDALAHTLEVIDTLCTSSHSSLEQVLEIKKAMRIEKGGFKNRIFCTTFELDENHPQVEHYRSKPKEYTEL
jgi:predicted house-cleaning noncanonical NTP pyrophosphatase (MazG superfamily)